MDFIDKFIKSFNKLKGDLDSNANSRYFSQEHWDAFLLMMRC